MKGTFLLKSPNVTDMAITPPSIHGPNGEQLWLKDSKRHRERNKPAFVGSDVRIWYANGVFHRDDDKPAFLHSNGSMSWYTNGHYQRSVDSTGLAHRAVGGRIRTTQFEYGSLRRVFVSGILL